jgi:hypothetical protein
MTTNCQIIAPTLPDGVHITRVASAFETLRKELCEVFGGYIETNGRGGWVDGDGELIVDEVAIFDIAIFTGAGRYGHNVNQFAECNSHLRSIAITLRESLKQDCIFVRYGSGTVELV